VWPELRVDSRIQIETRSQAAEVGPQQEPQQEPQLQPLRFDLKK
jgi:hypothetical protein